MTDRYTRAVLTIIAAALVGLLAVQLTPAAQAQIEAGCGSMTNPCYVKTLSPVEVYVTNMPPPMMGR